MHPAAGHLPADDPVAHAGRGLRFHVRDGGSTLRGAIIARHVERNLGFTRDDGCRYFRCYGDDVGAMWKAFGSKLLELCTPEDGDTVVASATMTFQVLQLWLEQQEFISRPPPAEMEAHHSVGDF
jgi:heme oxygenase